MTQPITDSCHHVTAMITHQVKPGRTQSYEDWIKGISAAARQFEGHLGVSILRPQAGKNPNYIIVLQFDHIDHLQTWLDSDIRKDWIERVQPLIRADETVQVLTGLETWFYLPSLGQGTSPPPRYKMAVVTWIGVCLAVGTLSTLLAGFYARLPFLIRLMVSSGLVVTALTYLVMPQLTRLFRPWLYGKRA